MKKLLIILVLPALIAPDCDSDTGTLVVCNSVEGETQMIEATYYDGSSWLPRPSYPSYVPESAGMLCDTFTLTMDSSGKEGDSGDVGLNVVMRAWSPTGDWSGTLSESFSSTDMTLVVNLVDSDGDDIPDVWESM